MLSIRDFVVIFHVLVLIMINKILLVTSIGLLLLIYVFSVKFEVLLFLSDAAIIFCIFFGLPEFDHYAHYGTL